MAVTHSSKSAPRVGRLAACCGVLLCAWGMLIASSPVAHAAGSAAAEPTLSPATQPTAAPPTTAPIKLVPLSEAMETRGDLSLQNATIQQALFTIGSTWQINIVVGKEVEGTVSCVYKQAPLREVLDAILLANGYSYRAVGESLVVQKTQEVGSANPLFESAAIPITHSDMGEVVSGAKLLLSNQGQLQALESSNSILIVDFVDRVDTIRKFVEQMDAAAAKNTGGVPTESYKRLQVAYFHTQYIPVDNAKEPLAAVLSTMGKVATMPAENRLVIVDFPSNIELAGRVLEKIDRPRPQVRITGLIYDISLQDAEQLGFNWGAASKGNYFASGTVFPFASDLTAVSTFGAPGTLTFRSLDTSVDIAAVARLMQNAKDSRLLADPHVTVEENEKAEMGSVQEIPYQQITQSELGGQIGTTAFKPVGITLTVTPQIAADGTVKMAVNQTFSRVAGFTETDNQPIVDSRNATTSVRVANRQTLVIGGLRQRSDNGSFIGIPVLKDIKYVGALFRYRDTDVRESELIVFIQPEIVDYVQSMNSREYMALDTANCRLDAIPRAEGCANGCNQHQSNCELVPFPAVDEQPGNLEQSEIGNSQTRPMEGVGSMRTPYGERFRQQRASAEPGTTPTQTPAEKTAQKSKHWWSLGK
jgi:general secretion pathway protein D